MKKIISLIKACMTSDMSLFKIKNNNQSKRSRVLLPIFLFIMVFFSIWSYANMIIEPLTKIHLEYVLLSIFVLFTFILTLVEGIYKSSNLLFNCKDDNLLLSLPIKRRTVLFIRVFKFYVFELIYNTMFMAPAMITYIRYVKVTPSYYPVSIIMLLLLPIIPIVLSIIIGMLLSATSTKFKYKNIAQIILTTIILLFVFYISFNLENVVKDLALKATSINDLITRLYYPAGAYVKMITNFDILDLLLFIIINISLFALSIYLLGNTYFKVNSRAKAVKTNHNHHNNYKIKTNKVIPSLIKKEFTKFISSPVFVTNAGFGLVLFVLGCIILPIKFESLTTAIATIEPSVSIETIKSNIPVILFGLICTSSLLSSITSSMISLEYKSFNILKSLPVKPYTIILSKIYTAVIIMLPFILIGDIITFINFKFTFIQIVLIIISSIIIPLVAETLGIIINIKYPKMDAENDTQVVKQSMSSMVAVMLGMLLTFITIYSLAICLNNNMNIDLIILLGLIVYTLIYIILLIYLNNKSIKEFNLINC